MKTLYVTLFLLGLATLNIAQDSEVVVNLLGDLKNNAKKELLQLEKDWSETKGLKQTVINSLTNSAQAQRGECNNRDQDVVNKERDISITLNFISWLEKRVTENTARIELLDKVKCRTNSNFINDVKNSKLMLHFISFMKKALKSTEDVMNLLRLSLKEQLVTLLQKVDFKTHFDKFAQQQQRIMNLLQTRDINLDDESDFQSIIPEFFSSDVETANGNNLIQLSQTQSVWNFILNIQKKEVLNILNDAEKQVLSFTTHSQDKQVASAMGYNDFRELLLKENDSFNVHVGQENDNLQKLQNQLITVLKASASCKARLTQINQALQIANEDISNAESNFLAVKERIEGEIELFEDVQRVYSRQVA